MQTHHISSRPTGKAVNRPQRIVGIDMRFLGMSILLPVLVHGAIDSWKAAVGIFIVMCCIGRVLSRKDPNIVRVLLAFSRQKKLYDPLKRVYFRMKVEDKIRG